jgi:tight adherence protein C
VDPALLQTAVTAVAFLLISGAAVGTLVSVTGQARTGARLRARLSGTESRRGPRRSSPAQGAAQTRLIGFMRKLGDGAAERDPGQVSVLRQKLIQAGFVSRESVPIYLGVKLALLTGTAMICILTVPWLMRQFGGLGAAAAAGGVSIIAILGPEHVLKGRTKKLQQEYRDGFPDLLDLLVASVEAGLSLDAAVNRVADEMGRRYPHLAEHLQILTRELRAGRSRKDAWSAMADRLGIDEARGLATMLRQAEEMGTSLGETLAVFSDDMRTKRTLRAEEKAMALPAKLTLPLILFIFPCLLGVLMLPAVVKVMAVMAK